LRGFSFRDIALCTRFACAVAASVLSHDFPEANGKRGAIQLHSYLFTSLKAA